jgi:hypothetical protein
VTTPKASCRPFSSRSSPRRFSPFPSCSGFYLLCVALFHEVPLLCQPRDSCFKNQTWGCRRRRWAKGVIFARELEAARTAGRVCTVPIEAVLRVDTAWDLGVCDATAIWLTQSLRSGEFRVIDYSEASGEGLPITCRCFASAATPILSERVGRSRASGGLGFRHSHAVISGHELGDANALESIHARLGSHCINSKGRY